MRAKHTHGWSLRPGMKLNKANRSSRTSYGDRDPYFADDDDPAILWNEPPVPDLTVRWTVKVGTIKNGHSYLLALESAGWEVNRLLSEFLERPAFTCVSEVKDLDLVSVSVDELGFDEASYADICWTAQKKLGLELCPAEVAAALLLTFGKQLESVVGSDGHHWPRPAIAPIPGWSRKPSILRIRYDYGNTDHSNGSCLTLEESSSYDDIEGWHRDYRFIFVKPRAK
ncbi:MAG TPA: hypothetical protein VOA87_21690 [Thermoanaerobaculia bacterium]|nr:hypothetical protein [Thermoanaerobaculia bacterium]